MQTFVNGLWKYDFYVFFNSNTKLAIYGMLFIILFLENGFIPLSFLPGDSLLILVGVLISKGMMNFFISFFILISASGLGYWMSYIQGKWLKKRNITKKFLLYISLKNYKRANFLLFRYGILALFFGRFIGFIRTILPTLAGISGLSNSIFQIFNWMSAIFWVLTLVTLGFFLGETYVFNQYEQKIILILMIIPCILLISGLLISLYIFLVYMRKNMYKK